MLLQSRVSDRSRKTVILVADSAGLDWSALRGLIGELLILENRLFQLPGLDDAVSAWTGPLGLAQDFRLPSGQRIEVKEVNRYADSVLVNGLGQLDGGCDLLQLVVVRLEDTGRDAPDALTVPLLVERLRTRLADSPAALRFFNSLLRFVGWDDTDEGNEVIVRLVADDENLLAGVKPNDFDGESAAMR